MINSDQKQSIRSVSLAKRVGINKDLKQTYDHIICDKLWGEIIRHQVKHIHTYLPMGDEINLYPFIQRLIDNNFQVYTSKTCGKGILEHYSLLSLDNLSIGNFGTPFPSQAISYTGDYDMIIVPGLAFDIYNNRLGYGGGYYDRFLAKHSKSIKIGAFYSFQEVDLLPKEKHDIPLDIIITEKDID